MPPLGLSVSPPPLGTSAPPAAASSPDPVDGIPVLPWASLVDLFESPLALALRKLPAQVWFIHPLPPAAHSTHRHPSGPAPPQFTVLYHILAWPPCSPCPPTLLHLTCCQNLISQNVAPVYHSSPYIYSRPGSQGFLQCGPRVSFLWLL